MIPLSQGETAVSRQDDPISAGYLLSSGRDVPIDRFLHPIPLSKAVPARAPLFSCNRHKEQPAPIEPAADIHFICCGTII